MKQISNKAFTKFITLMANQPISASRLSALIDASPEEGIDVLMFGRLKEVLIADREMLDEFLTKNVSARLGKDSEYESVESIKVISPMKFIIKVKYFRRSIEAPAKETTYPLPTKEATYPLEYSATDDRLDGLLDFEFTDLLA